MVHDWSIAEREYSRQEARRGRRHAFEDIDPRDTALVVVDMVPFFSNENTHARDIVAPINRLAHALRAAGGLVSWVLPSADDPHPALSREFYGEDIAELYRRSGGEGPLAARLCPQLDTEPDDLFVEKRTASAFFPGYSPLPDELAARRIRTVIIAGTVTNVCCEGSARDARALGYRVIMAADANAAPTDGMHNATLHTVYRSFGDVRSAAEILDMIAKGAPTRSS